MPADSIDDCLRGEQRPRIDEFDTEAFLMLYGALGPDAETEFAPRKLAIFLDSTHIVTVHQEPLKTLDKLIARAERNAPRVLSQGSDRILFNIIDSIVDNYLLLVENFDKQLDQLEEESLSSNVEAGILVNILDLRKQMLELRSLAKSVREMLQPIAVGELNYVSEKLESRFVYVRDHLTIVIENIDNLRELLHGVRDNYHAALANQTNRTMQTLTIFASLFLPLSLIAGVYGMNTQLWPPADAPYSFWAIIGSMGIIVFVMLAFFKRNKWF